MIQVVPGSEAEELKSDYLVRLDNFEGPLDLLLHLIKGDEIEIWEISISRITQQYVQYLELMEALNLEIAGEFLVMAAALMRIKSKGLLPRPITLTPDGDEPCSEDELIQKLLTYKLFKEAATALKKRQEEAGPRFPRGFRPQLPEGYSYPLEEVDLFALAEALRSAESTVAREEPVHEVHLENVRLEDQVAFVLARMDEAGGRLTFGSLFGKASGRMVLAVTFLAVLELARQQVIQIMQDQPFEDIWIVMRECEGAVMI